MNAKLSRELHFLKSTVKNLRAVCAKDKVKAPTKATIYVATSFDAEKVATLQFLQTLWDEETQSLPPKHDMLQVLAARFLETHANLKVKKKAVMQFAAFVLEEVNGGLGKAALDVSLLCLLLLGSIHFYRSSYVFMPRLL